MKNGNSIKTEWSDFEAHLASLELASSVDRGELMFKAGRASAVRSVRYWKMFSIGLAAGLALLFMQMHSQQPKIIEHERVVYVQRPEGILPARSSPQKQQEQFLATANRNGAMTSDDLSDDSTASDQNSMEPAVRQAMQRAALWLGVSGSFPESQEAVALRESRERTEAVSYIRLRQQVLEYGLAALPVSHSSYAEPVDTKDLMRELLGPGSEGLYNRQNGPSKNEGFAPTGLWRMSIKHESLAKHHSFLKHEIFEG